MKCLKLLFVVFFICVLEVKAQSSFKLEADIRPRFEYRHGFNNLFPNNAEASVFVRQRSRLNIGYNRVLNDKKLKLFIALQDISTWGDTRQILPQDNNDSFALFQAWAEIELKKGAIKLGRQVISYDDQRIFGGLDWAMQGRFHDAAIFKFDKEGRELHIGVAVNSFGEPTSDIEYPHSAQLFSYKYMEYLRYSKKFGNGKLSLLFLNNSYQKTKPNPDKAGETLPDGTYERQTLGAYYKKPINKFTIDASFYFQRGYINQATELNGAYQFAVNLGYKPNKTLFALGAEMLSGTEQGVIKENNSFFPLFGTNHKFNGFMDYFYVGNHANGVGLNDINAKVVLPIGKAKLLIKGHYFMANGKLSNNKSAHLANELDIVLSKNIADDIKLVAGFSYLGATESLGIVKGDTTGKLHENTNYWAFVMFKINPTLFLYEKE